MERKIYLKKLNLSDALGEYIKRLQDCGFFTPQGETIPTTQALGRVLAKPVYANRSVPTYNSAAMDGIMVRSVDTIGACKTNPKILSKNQFKFVNTGNPLEPPFDAVIMIENIHIIDDDHIQIFESVPAFHNVRLIGEDLSEKDMIFTRYHHLKPYDLSLLLAAGVFEVEVLKKLKVIVIPTGTEIVSPESELKEGFIPETNSTLIKSHLSQIDPAVDVEIHPVVEDKYESVLSTLFEAISSYDMILLNAGSSAGSFDYSYHVLEELGQVIAHGLNIRPGKPTILATVNGKPVIGLPGYPGSCYVVLEQIVKPIALQKLRITPVNETVVEAISTRRIFSSISEDEYIRVSLSKVKDRYVFVPLKRGAASMDALARMDGTIVVPKGVEVLDEGQKAIVKTCKSIEEIDKNILFIGSHDPLLSILADMVKEKDFTTTIAITNVGSMGGLIAIAKEYAHIGGLHLFDPQSGTYNLPYLKKYLKDFVLVKFLKRNQGLIVQRSNPKGIKDLFDLVRKDVRFVNRQKASGTRILLDYHLSVLGIDPMQINGYDDEEFTHISLALKIKKGLADVGLGVASAAQIMDLDFIPLYWEEYDLLILTEFSKDDRFELIMNILLSQEFRNNALTWQGYDLSNVGQIIRGDQND
ncbi:molybdopterin biosynthesis protein [Pseudothermotoga sp. U03pept]|uniref:molybdopterin biosynthesis protein n=1 Tax=Pseudothermotoga sp. U03pept TaxID=3447012 RepID=UPI003F01A41B